MGRRLLQAFYAVSVLATVIEARPYHRGVHEHWHHKRGLIIQTITDIVMKTVEETTTVYYDATGTGAPAVATTTLTTITPTVTTSATSDPAVVPAPESNSAAVAETTQAPLTGAAAATSSSPFSSPSEVGPASSAAPTSDDPVPTSPATTSAAAAPVAASSSSTTSAPAPSTSSSDTSMASLTGSSTATCDSTTAACSGDITYYTAGLGACGETSDGSSQDVLALPYGFMGTQSNGNPYCGKNVAIYNPANGKTAQGVVVDKCMGCTGRSIDLSNHLFDQLAEESVGRVAGIVWYFTD